MVTPLVTARIPPRAPAWKMVDEAHALAVFGGSLRLGPLASYSDLENGRADPLDGAIEIHAPELGVDTVHERAIARRMGLLIGPDAVATNVRVKNYNYTEVSPPVWALCMAAVGCDHDWSPEVPKAIFAVSDIYRLARTIAEQNPDHIEAFELGTVTYKPARIGPEAALRRQADPFDKDPYFEPEREVRIIFHRRNWPADLDNQDDLITRESPEVARLLTIVRWDRG